MSSDKDIPLHRTSVPTQDNIIQPSESVRRVVESDFIEREGSNLLEETTAITEPSEDTSSSHNFTTGSPHFPATTTTTTTTTAIPPGVETNQSSTTHPTSTASPTPPSILTRRKSSSTAIDTTHATSPINVTSTTIPSSVEQSNTNQSPGVESIPNIAPTSDSNSVPSSSSIPLDMSGSRSYPSMGGASSSLATAAARGMPMLSGVPPVIESDACRSCGKSFIPLFRKAHNCNHCGFQYCDSCCTGQALLPRSFQQRGGGGGAGNPLEQLGEVFGIPTSQGRAAVGGAGNGSGYEMVEVCKYCIPMLQVTSGHPPFLRSLPLKRLQAYTKAYGLNTLNAIEKEDFVQAVLKAKSTTTGCLAPDRESYYRRRSVPKEGVIPTPPPIRPVGSTTTNGVRPTHHNGTNIRPQTQPTTSTQPRVPASSGAGTGTRTTQRPSPHATTTTTTTTTTTNTSKPPNPTLKKPPTPPVPTINSLVSLPTSYLSTLSIGTLKAILFENHVRVNFAEILEKDELVKRVSELCKDERHRLERQAREEAAEEEAAVPSFVSRTSMDREDDSGRRHVPTGPKASVERDGLCVVCQENDAQLAVVDCGHLSMCQECSALVMKTSRECPLCRTRIVTEQRLIRIFRT